MKYRDSSGVTHFESNLVVGVKPGNDQGVRISGASTSGECAIETVADSTVAHLTIYGKGTGSKIQIGSTAGGSTCGVLLGSTTVTNSSAAAAYAVRGVFSASLAWTTTDVNSRNCCSAHLRSAIF